MTQKVDVVVVGAGMVGAALACGLGQSGFRVALIDRDQPQQWQVSDSPDLRVSALSAGSETVLRRLGVWDRMSDCRVTPYRRLAVEDATAHPLSKLLPKARGHTTFDAADLHRPHLGHIVENGVTQAALQARALECESIVPLFGRSPDRLVASEKGVELTLDDGNQVEAALLVGADGANSRIRSLAGIGTMRDQYQQHAMVISVRYQGDVEDITWQAFHPSGPRAFLPLHASDQGGAWASLVWYDAPERLDQLGRLPDAELLETIQREFPEHLPPLIEIGGRGRFPLAKQDVSTYHQNGTVLIGDAAHTINPLAGQGVNLGFQDAASLQRVLVEARWNHQPLNHPDVLARYQQERQPANRRMMLAMDLFYHAFSNRIPPLHLARNFGLTLADRLPFAKQAVTRYAMGIDDRLPTPLEQLLERLPGTGVRLP